MIIKKSASGLVDFAKGKIWDYDLGDAPFGLSYQEHNGRVPLNGWGINTVSWEAYYIISGTARVFVDDEHYTAGPGDVIVLKPNQKSYMIADNLRIVTITEPDWTEDQYTEVDSV